MSNCFRSTCFAFLFFILSTPALAANARLQQVSLTTEISDAPGNVTSTLNETQPVSMASGDFDEDGVTDLLVSYSAGDGNYIALYRGNVDSIFPYSANARQRRASGVGHDAPFFETEQLFSTEQAFDFLVAGDFDADGHLDLAGGSRGDTYLHFLSGDGAGQFENQPPIALGGALSTLAAGEVNRRDGLPDLVIAIETMEDAALLVFENPRGALTGAPEIIALSEPASAIALAQLDGLPGHDIAIGVGNNLVLVHGRDRKLTQDSERRASVDDASIDIEPMGARILGLAAGNLVPDSSGNSELSVFLDSGQVEILKAETRTVADANTAESGWSRTEWSRTENHFGAGSLTSVSPVYVDQSIYWMVNRSEYTEPEVVTGDDQSAPELAIGQTIATLPMRLNADALMDQVVISHGESKPVVVVTVAPPELVVNSSADNTTGGDSFCTLREAIIEANVGGGGDCGVGTAGGLDTISFAIDGGGSRATIALSDALPDITDSVSILGNSQCGTPPCIKLDGSGVTDPGDDTLNALTIDSEACLIQGLVFANWPYGGIQLQGLTGSHGLEGNYFGVDFDGTTPMPLAGSGLEIQSPLNNIGGLTSEARNIFSRSRNGITIANTLLGESDASRNTILGNYIGTDITGTVDLGNTFSGIYLTEASSNIIGGTSAGAGNLVSGNDSGGVFLRELTLDDFTTESNLVQGNLIGTDISGTVALGNMSDGIDIWDASGNTIGGTSATAGNLISNNGFRAAARHGISILRTETYNRPTENNFVLGNLIGTDITGKVAQGNAIAGVLILSGDSNVIGGVTPGAGNVISANGWAGVVVYVGLPAYSATTNVIQGNMIGTDISGMEPLGNASTGIYLWTDSTDTHVGGTDAGARNVISSNFYGIHIQASGNHRVQGNYIGTNAAGTAAIPNLNGGITISNDASGNLIGDNGSGPPPPFTPGDSPLAGDGGSGQGITIYSGNLISGNTGTGVFVSSDSPDNVIKGNFIGTDINGSSALPNTGFGIATYSTGAQQIGGPDPRDGNLISGNDLVGIVLGAPGSGNIVQGNLVGVDVSGTAALGNGQQGISISSENNLIGGSAPDMGNVIAANGFDGIVIADAAATGNRIEGNSIGIDANGLVNLGNDSNGIIMLLGASDNEIVGNNIQNSGNAGIVLINDAGSGNTFSQNQITGNAGMGIDLGADAVTPNDNLDPDPGPNNLQNFPVIASVDAGSTIINGSLNSLPNSVFTIEFFANTACDATSYGEGETYLGTIQRTTNGSGIADISTTLPASAGAGNYLTATATAPDGSTSEFSNCVIVGLGDTDTIFKDGFEAL